MSIEDQTFLLKIEDIRGLVRKLMRNDYLKYTEFKDCIAGLEATEKALHARIKSKQ